MRTGVLHVGEAASEAVVVPAHASVAEALSVVASSPALSFLVVRSNGTCLGVVRASVLRAASSGSAGLRVDALVQGAPVLRDAEGLAVGASALVGSGVGVALIVDADERLTGVLRPVDVLTTLAAHGDID